ncbi:alpha/beta hydrolase family protein [Nonomuraea typhae]|uniref:Alpha/beta hydrolase family protein n=1 Tax=Nonomuraea typhae TaxID=2603600 RepID=A0ABW7Z8R3_9ACTN
MSRADLVAPPQAMPYGTWPSPVSPADVARCEAPVEWVGFLGDGLCWVEARPEQEGRSALVWADGDRRREVVPGWHVRSRVIEYGGSPWAPVSAAAEDGLVLVNGADQRVHRWRPGQEPVPLTPPAPAGQEYRYAEFTVADDEVWCLRETVLDPEGREVRRHLVSFPLSGTAAEDASGVVERAASHHFMSGPKLSPDGRRVAWIGWNHPDMPWDATEVLVADRPAGGADLRWRRVAGGSGEAVSQIEWARDQPEALLVAGDISGWWNIHRIDAQGRRSNLCPRPEEFAEALWRIGQRWFLPLDDGSIAVVHGGSGRRLGLLRADGSLDDLGTDYTEWLSLATDGRRLAAVAASPRHRRTVLRLDPGAGSVDVVRPAVEAHDEFASTPELRTWRHPSGAEVHAHLYPPHHPSVVGPEGELPPYVVIAHGGPTSRSHRVRNQEFAYFTSRGIGVVDVQYGGSTGFGRAYRERLRGQWGVVDVEDVRLAAVALAADGLADPRRIAVRGGSAGGWTAACALGRAPDVFCAAGIYYPVISPELWHVDGTHDFESRYLDSLLGRWPEEREVYAERSPLRDASKITAPFVVFQGEEDKVCPPAQARALFDEVGGESRNSSYLTFPGEGHGFVRLSTFAACLEAELGLFRLAFERDRMTRGDA